MLQVFDDTAAAEVEDVHAEVTKALISLEQRIGCVRSVVRSTARWIDEIGPVMFGAEVGARFVREFDELIGHFIAFLFDLRRPGGHVRFRFQDNRDGGQWLHQNVVVEEQTVQLIAQQGGAIVRTNLQVIVLDERGEKLGFARRRRQRHVCTHQLTDGVFLMVDWQSDREQLIEKKLAALAVQCRVELGDRFECALLSVTIGANASGQGVTWVRVFY